MRETVELEDLSGVADAEFIKPVRFVFSSPRRGGPRVTEIRAALAPKGRLRLSGTLARIFADFDPGPVEEPLITLDTIVRSDVAGLERMLLTSLEHVDAIVLHVDGRSDSETFAVARAYADVYGMFFADNIGMSQEDWEVGKIDFAAARNIGRKLVTTPWTFVIDSDEYVESAPDLRALARLADDTIGSFSPLVRTHGADYRDPQRLARTSYLWKSATHNQLQRAARPKEIDMMIVSDTRLRERAEVERRDAQRQLGIEDMVEAAAKGDLNAIFHVAKHKIGVDDAETVRLVEDYRSRSIPGDILADDRMWLALALAFRFYEIDNLGEANRWACRALLDGPSVAAFCVLGDVAEDEGHLERAMHWYQAACSMEEVGKIKWPGLTELRFGRLSGILRALIDPTTASTIAKFSDD